jgi:uncharacterized RDD family membrane protein YckC
MPSSLHYAGFWIRFLAYLIDAIILALLGGLLFGGGNEGWQGLISLAYIIGFWTWKGATPGKMICKLRIVDTEGKPIKIQTVLLRVLGYLVSGIVLCIGFFWIGFDAKKQGWHDKIAKTFVVKVD